MFAVEGKFLTSDMKEYFSYLTIYCLFLFLNPCNNKTCLFPSYQKKIRKKHFVKGSCYNLNCAKLQLCNSEDNGKYAA